jgi:hypothetical protein
MQSGTTDVTRGVKSDPVLDQQQERFEALARQALDEATRILSD